MGSEELTFTANADMGFVIGQYEEGFVAAINRVAAEPRGGGVLAFYDLGWGDAEAAELRLALQYAAAKCAFPEGAVGVWVKGGNRISEEAMATLPPCGIFIGESVDWGAPGDAQHAWKGKFLTA